MNISGKTKICLSIGDPIIHSLSPSMHNAGYKALGIDDQFVFIAAKVKIDAIKNAVWGIRAFNFRGMSCTTPHKLAVMQYLDVIDPVAQKIGAVNTVVNDGNKLTGYNTDWIGATSAIEKVTSIKNKKAAILGGGGAARAMVYGLTTKGADVTLYNRTVDKAEAIAKDFDCKADSLENKEEIKKADIIINATTIGMSPNQNQTPLEREYIKKNHIVLDAIYFPRETLLLKEAKEQGATIISGLEMLLYQGTAQFTIYTGKEAPEETMRKSLYEN